MSPGSPPFRSRYRFTCTLVSRQDNLLILNEGLLNYAVPTGKRASRGVKAKILKVLLKKEHLGTFNFHSNVLKYQDYIGSNL